MSHDDGILVKEITKSDIILLGVSRTSKTPHLYTWPTKDLKLQIFP